jgi:hypothetical protein
MSTMTSNMSTTSTSPTTRRHTCGCPDSTPSQACCCNLVCFDRPNYFCGHLLTDGDLTLQQKYVMEKNKLYHRTMDGYGIVCGLKLTCDCDCKGHIWVHDGFAIDDCGNDLVVCEATRFDVIGALKAKGMLFTDPMRDECGPEERRSRCECKQCFYVTICYEETESNFETPFQSTCSSGPKQCLPTRIHEGVRFDVTETLPLRHNYLEDLRERIEDCFHLNDKSPVGTLIAKYTEDLLRILCNEQGQEWPRDACEKFCILKAYFLNHLKTNPDQFNCNLFHEVACLNCSNPFDGDDEECRRIARGEVQEAFRTLLYYVQRYQYDCVFGDLIFTCQQPCEAHCLVLGTVEVLDGKLIRVCNMPRNYLKAPANLLQVLIYEIMTNGLRPGKDCGDNVPCCPDYDQFDPCYFLWEHKVDKRARAKAATSILTSFSALSDSLHKAFDFTDSMAMSPEVLAGMRGRDDVREGFEGLLNKFSISQRKAAVPEGGLNIPTPMQALQSHALLRANDSVVLYTQDQGSRVEEVRTDFVTQISPDRAVGQELETIVVKFNQQTQEIADLRTQIEALRTKIDGGNPDDPKKPSKKGGQKDS